MVFVAVVAAVLYCTHKSKVKKTRKSSTINFNPWCEPWDTTQSGLKLGMRTEEEKRIQSIHAGKGPEGLCTHSVLLLAINIHQLQTLSQTLETVTFTKQ